MELNTMDNRINTKKIGDNILSIMRRKGVKSTNELSRISGVTAPTLGKFTNKNDDEQYHNFHTNVYTKLADALKVDVRELMFPEMYHESKEVVESKSEKDSKIQMYEYAMEGMRKEINKIKPLEEKIREYKEKITELNVEISKLKKDKEK